MVGLRIRKLRNADKISQQKLADKTGISKGRLGRIERAENELSVTEAIILSSFFNVSLGFLLTGN